MYDLVSMSDFTLTSSQGRAYTLVLSELVDHFGNFPMEVETDCILAMAKKEGDTERLVLLRVLDNGMTMRNFLAAWNAQLDGEWTHVARQLNATHYGYIRVWGEYENLGDVARDLAQRYSLLLV